MTSIDPRSLEERARQLVDRVARECDENTLGSATVAIYDTAWVSMVARDKRWIFPESFQYLLDSQSADGGWKSGSTLQDDFLSTLASLFAIVRHSRATYQNSHGNLPDLEIRASKAKSYLESTMRLWELEEPLQVGFEILVPNILSMLENEQIFFDFPGREPLEKLKKSKMKGFDPEIFYSMPNSLLHSLEGLVGRIAFDRLGHHKTFGSMMASPASTAAYLIYSPIWDLESEQYLRSVVANGAGKGTGGVPSVFPIPIFESTWVMTTLMQGGFEASTLGKNNVTKIADYIENLFRKQHGLLGFAPSILPDADDTAKGLYALNLLGRVARPDQMIDCFKNDVNHFKTFSGERNSSFSANCNALNALLHSPDVNQYTAVIVSSANFLCDLWWSGEVSDKWNTSPQYCKMLLAEALTRLLYLWDVNVLSDIPDELVRDRIPVVLIQILNQTLLNEASGRGWSSKTSPEILAYRILTLKAVHSLPSHALLYDSILFDIHSGQQILSQCQDDWAKPAPLWIEKVTYGSTILSEAYCLASMFTLQPSHKWSPRVISLLEMPEKAILKTTKFLGTLTCFQSEPHWKLRASAIEGFTFLPQLKSVRADILPRQTNAKNEYIAYIPLTWILINNLRSLDTSADILWDMMVLTVCNFRMDEYMETAAAKFSRADLEGTKPIIADLFANDRPRLLQTQNLPDADSDNNLRDHGVILNASSFNGDDIPATAKKPEPNGVDVAAEASLKYVVSSLVSFRAIIGHYVRSMLAYPLILDASPADRFNLRSLLATFLLSHIAQIEDNLRFSTQMSWSSSGTSIFASPRTTFHSWAHSTGADSVSCPFSFAFFTCLLGASLAQSPPGRKSPAADCFTSVRQKYLAEQLCSHLAVMSRLYNDFGSLARDRLEANINSVNFPEFHPLSRNSRSWSGEDSQAMKEGYLKRELLELAELERRNSDQAQERLISDIEADTQGAGARIRMRKVKAVRLFAGVTGLYADIYVARDLSNRIEKNG